MAGLKALGKNGIFVGDAGCGSYLRDQRILALETKAVLVIWNAVADRAPPVLGSTVSAPIIPHRTLEPLSLQPTPSEVEDFLPGSRHVRPLWLEEQRGCSDDRTLHHMHKDVKRNCAPYANYFAGVRLSAGS